MPLPADCLPMRRAARIASIGPCSRGIGARRTRYARRHYPSTTTAIHARSRLNTLRAAPPSWRRWKWYFAEMMAREEADCGPWIAVPGHGRIQAKDYARLREHVTGGHDAPTRTP